MALDDADMGVKVIAGLAVFALLMALLSNGDPDNDAWSGGERADAGEPSGGDDTAAGDDPWTAGSSYGGADGGGGGDDSGGGDPDGRDGPPDCDAAARFSADGGTVRLPVVRPIAPFGSPRCVLDGSGAAEPVRALQQALAACNDQAVAVDGRYGPQTKQAVREVQERAGIGVDGVYGPETRQALAWPLEGDGDGDGDACTSSTAAD